SITYPPVQSIIKNTFTLRGTASDDNELVGVLITVTNTETDEVFDSYQATVDRATNTWSFAANRRNEDGSFEFEDGKYQIVATAVDGANRKTVASTTYEIDNTAPVLVLNRPGTVGPVGGVKPEVYGSELKLTGSANDDHALDLVSMRVFRADGTPIGEPLTYANVSGVGMEILLAKHYASPADADQQALTDRYAAIYDHSTGGTQNFYCLVDISDYAREYDPPANVASADNTRGNVSQAFWLYDGIYSRVFDKSGFGLAMSDLTSVLSGRYASVATAEEVKTYLAENQQDSTVWSDTAVTFSLNPENSPYYEVVGYNALATNEAITAQASNGTNLTVRVSAGRDQRPLLSDTIRVYLDPCNANGAPLLGEGDNILLLASIAELDGNTAAIEERNDRLSKTGNDYVVSVDVGTLVNGNYYLVKVEGKDQAGNEITDLNGTFGFQVIASGNPPVLVVTSPPDLDYTSADSVPFTGTVEAEGGLESLTATVRIIRLSDGGAVRNVETFTINPSDSSWAFTLDKLNDIESEDGLCMATVTLKATDLKNTITEQTLRLYIDHQAPKATITKVTPYYGYVAGVYTVNGTVGATLSLTDNDQLVSYSYTINGGTPSTPVAVTSPVVSLSIPSINTVDYTDDQDLPFTVKLRDRAGNEATVNLSNVIHIDQDTDRPELVVTNLDVETNQALAADNWFSETELKGSLTDDDGIASVSIIIDDGTVPVITTELTDAPELGGFGKSRNFTLNLNAPPVPNVPLPDGIYRLTAIANDIYSLQSTPVVIWFSYDNAKPVLLGDTGPAGISRTRTTFSLSGTAADTNALRATGSIRITQSYNGGSAHELPAVTITLNPDNTSCTWEALGLPRNPSSLTSSAATDGSHDGTYVYSVIATDRSGKSSTALAKTITFDTIAPVIGEITHPAESGANNLIAGSTTFRGEASDAGTGVTLVQYSLNSTDWFNANGFTIWNASFTFAPTEPEGPKTLYVRASDAAGNVSAIAERPFIYDTGAPELAAATVPAGLTLTNTGFSLSGSAEDGYKLRELNSVVITQQLGNGDKIPVPVSITPNGDNTSCTWTIGTLPRIPVAANIGTQVPFDGSRDGTYKYEITVYDAAGRSTISEITVQLDSSKPVITEVTKPAESGTGNFISEATDFSGKTTDVGSGGVLVQYSLNNSDWHDANGFAIWNASFEFGPAEPEGEKTLYVRATDAAGNISDVFTRPFVYDKSAPSLTAANTVPADLTLTNTGFFLSGSAEDGYKLRELNSVVITQQLGSGSKIQVPVTINPVDAQHCTWTLGKLVSLPRKHDDIGLQVDLDGSGDGIYKYEITVYDAAGQRSDSETITVQLDSRAPTAVINVPAANSVVGTNASFQGGASDPAPSSGIREIRYSLDGRNWTQIVPSATWNTTHLFDPADAEGEKTLRVVAEDTAGNVSPVVPRNFIFDRANPTITINGDSARSTGTTFSLTGNAKDSWGVERIVVTQNGVALPDIDASDSTDFNWELASLPRNPANPSATLMADDVFTYTVQAIDRANKSTFATVTVTIDTTPPDKNDITAPTAGSLGVNALSGSTYLFRGEAGEPEEGVGVAKIWYQITNTEAASANIADYTELATGGNWSFTKNFPAEIAEGTGYWLHVLAEDRAGNRTPDATSVQFDVDLANPFIHDNEIGVSTLVNRREGFELGGPVTDSHGIASVTITQSFEDPQNPAGGTPNEITTNGPVLNPDDTWDLDNLPRGKTAGTIGDQELVDGTYEYQITAVDLVGKTHTITRRIRFDSVGPEIEFTSPSYTPAEGTNPEEISWMNSGTLAVTGRATDLTAVAGVYYSTAATAPPLPVQTDPEVPLADTDWTAQGWTKASGSLTNWSVPFVGLGQGVHAAWISAMDTNSNTTPANQIKFGVDTALPVVTGTAPLANNRELITISGNISDSNALDPDVPITITQRFNEEEPVPISGVNLVDSNPANGEGYSWTLANVPRNPSNPSNPIALNGSADGMYDFLITATDIAGKTREATISVRIDTRNPSLTVADAVADSLSGWVNRASLPLSGGVTDPAPSSGIMSVEYTHVDSAANVLTQILSVSGTNWSGNLPLENGTGQTLTITAKDNAGNTVTSTTYSFDVDRDPPVLLVVTPTAPQRTNLETAITVEYEAADEGPSDVASVQVTRIGSHTITAGQLAAVYDSDDDLWKLSIPPETFAGFSPEPATGMSYVVTTRVADAAGNTSTATFSLIVDKAPPSVGITAPVNNAVINKLTEIRGTANDPQLLERVDLYMETGPGTGEFPAVPTESFTGGDAYNWSYLFNTEEWNGAEYTGPVQVRAVATDEAGNTGTVTHTYTIDQESDRPRIRSNNPELIFNHDATGYPSTIQTKNIIGTIEDDDGMVGDVYIKVVDSEGAGDWESVSMSGTSFTYTVDQTDGAKTLYFRITDAKGT
ncbi:MAG TPA: Ig-like domain repeat protein, partial [Treponemataceae bacterium]|nr:Ig-like domain repeat protein [Treponemataceae bacterium]